MLPCDRDTAGVSFFFIVFPGCFFREISHGFLCLREGIRQFQRHGKETVPKKRENQKLSLKFEHIRVYYV